MAASGRPENDVLFEFPEDLRNAPRRAHPYLHGNEAAPAAAAAPAVEPTNSAESMLLRPVIRIPPFQETFSAAEADAWYQNAIHLFRAQIAAREGSGNMGKMYRIHTILLHLVGNILPELIMNSFYKKGELKAFNKANATNQAELDRLVRNVEEHSKRLKEKHEEMRTSAKPKLAHKTENIVKIASQLEHLEENRNARIYALAERNAERRGILYSRQQPFIELAEKVITEAAYLVRDDVTEMLNFIHGLVPYFRMKQIPVKSDEAYVHFRDQFARILSMLAGVMTHAQEAATFVEPELRAISAAAASATRGRGKPRRHVTRRQPRRRTSRRN